MRVMVKGLDRRFRGAMTAVMLLLAVLAPTGLATSAQGGPGAVTLMGSTVTCHNLWGHKPESSTPEMTVFQSADGQGWLYVAEGGFTLQPYELVEFYQETVGGTPSTIMEGNGIIFGGTVTDTGANMIAHQRYSDGETGLSLIIMAPHGGLATVMQSVQQNCTIQGVPFLDGQDMVAMASSVPGEGNVSTTTQPSAGTTTNTTTQPASGTTTNQPATGTTPLDFEIAGTVTLENGTAVGWSSYWTHAVEDSAPHYVTVQAPTGFDMFFVQDYGSHMTLEATWDTTKTAFGNGGTLLDEGQSPDGGYYGIWTATMPDGTVVYVMARAMYAPGTTTPTSTGFYAVSYLIEPMLVSLRQVAINGTPAWTDVDDATLMAIFQAGGPTGAPLFVATAPATTAQQTTQPSTGTVPQTQQPATTTTQPGTAPQAGQPATTTTTTTATGQTAPAATAQYASPQFGYTVSWAGGWTELADRRKSDTVNGTDGLGLYTGTPGAGALSIVGMNPGTWTPQSAMDYWLSPAYLAENQSAGTTVVLSRVDATRGGVVMVGPFSNEDPEVWVTVMEATFVSGQLEIDVSFTAPLSVFELVYADAQRSVLVNGMPVVGLFTAQEILAAAQ